MGLVLLDDQTFYHKTIVLECFVQQFEGLNWCAKVGWGGGAKTPSGSEHLGLSFNNYF
jgi:hypothetical protein